MIATILMLEEGRFGLVLIEICIEATLFFIISNAINRIKPQNVQLLKKKYNLYIIISGLIGAILTFIFRLLYEYFISPTNSELFLAIFTTISILGVILFLNKYYSGKDQEVNKKNFMGFLKEFLGLSIVIWIIALISVIVDIRNQPVNLKFKLGFLWALATLVIAIFMIKLVNAILTKERRIPTEILNNAILYAFLISYGIWALQLVILGLFLNIIFDLKSYIFLFILYLIAYFLLYRVKFLPILLKQSKIRLKLWKGTQESGTQSEIEKFEKNNIILDVQNLVTHFNTDEGIVQAVEDVSFQIRANEVVGLVGETGCGKSVTALSILQLVRYPGKIINGKVLFIGENILEKTEQEMIKYRGNSITMIFQDPLNSLNPVFKVGEQISEVFLLHKTDELLAETTKMENESIYSIAQKWSIKILKDVGIPDPDQIYDRYPHELSGGMRQRIMIAMALACSPKLLIADEPTTALDVTIQHQILKLMKDLQKKYHTSILYITHDLGIISKMCDRVAVMYSGKIIEYGSKRVIFERPYHPYTRGLIKAVPIVGKIQQKLAIIPGTVPNLIYPPSGCRFHPRCDYCFKVCEEIIPKSIEIEPNYFVSCHLYDPIYQKEATEVRDKLK